MKKQYPEKVYLIGAGPGEPGLFSLKGQEILKEADTVIYDALVGTGILGWIPETAKRIYVGKRSGAHYKSQSEIQEILITEGKQGGIVVRLKGGDPFIFGRGGEEAEALRKAGIPFEVVPGITSAAAVPAYAGIPVTHRGLASSFHVITGHKEREGAAGIDYEALVRAGGTDIFLMAVSEAQTICEGLMKAGMPKDMPAAFVQEGTTASQKKVISTVENLVRDGKREGIKAPAVLVVGEVCSLEPTCAWAEKRPLAGARIVVTRPRERSGRMAALLRTNGAEVLELPAIRIKRRIGGAENKRLARAFTHLEEYDWLVFTSPAGAECFFEELLERKMDMRTLYGKKVAVIGPATGKEFEKRGIFPDYMPERYYAKDLGEGLSRAAASGEKILILRASKGSEALCGALERAGLSYEDAALYDTVYPEPSPLTERTRELIETGQVDFVTFTSGSTVDGFVRMMGDDWQARTAFTAVCIGEQTEKAARAVGMRTVCSEIPSMESMLVCIRETYQSEALR